MNEIHKHCGRSDSGPPCTECVRASVMPPTVEPLSPEEIAALTHVPEEAKREKEEN